MSDRALAFDYSVPQAYCAQHGLRWADELVPEADAVDALCCHHAWVVNHLFNPKAWNWTARLYLAARFLFGFGARR